VSDEREICVQENGELGSDEQVIDVEIDEATALLAIWQVSDDGAVATPCLD
jgi:hypothetical protein